MDTIRELQRNLDDPMRSPPAKQADLWHIYDLTGNWYGKRLIEWEVAHYLAVPIGGLAAAHNNARAWESYVRRVSPSTGRFPLAPYDFPRTPTKVITPRDPNRLTLHGNLSYPDYFGDPQAARMYGPSWFPAPTPVPIPPPGPIPAEHLLTPEYLEWIMFMDIE